MNALPQYWKIYRLPAPGNSAETLNKRYEYWSSATAEAAFQAFIVDDKDFKQAVASGDDSIQQALLDYFKETSRSNDIRAKAGLCLRCYLSSSILHSCKKLASASVGSSNRDTLLSDLLLAALDDDGKTLFVLSQENGNKPLTLQHSKTTEPVSYWFLSLEILRGYDCQNTNRKSLKNWVYFVLPCHQRVKKVLNQFGLNRLSDWAQMNRAKPAQLELLSPRSRQLAETFHKVYRRDRLRQRQHAEQTAKSKKCSDPTPKQLKEMMLSLHQLNLLIPSPDALLEELRQVAKELQDIDAWRIQGGPITEPLELPDPETGEVIERRDIPSTEVNDPVEQEYEGILTFLREQQLYALRYGLRQGIDDRLTELASGRRKAYASKLLPGLKSIYCDGRSLRKSWPSLGFKNYSAAAKVIALRELTYQVRFRTIEKLLDIIVVRAQEMGLTAVPAKTDHLSKLMKEIELLVDQEVFEPAFHELQHPGAERSSLYAEELRSYLKHS